MGMKPERIPDPDPLSEPPCAGLFGPSPRRATRQVLIGNVRVGGDAPVVDGVATTDASVLELIETRAGETLSMAEVRASMRYVGQGHEVEVPVPIDRPLDGEVGAALLE